ncbi:MAG: hypothetical protein AAFW01_16840 [Pseudomonadota bacterium]
MTGEDDRPGLDDRALDNLIRDAAASDVDEAATRRAVMARIAAAERGTDWFAWLPALDARTAPAAFVLMLLLAGGGGYALPDLLGDVEALQFLDLASGGVGPGGFNALGLGSGSG